MSIFFCFIDQGFAQDLSGKWQGRLSQEAGGVFSDYSFEMELIQKGDQVEGTSMIQVQGHFGRMRLKGTFNGQRFHFTETEIIREKINTDFFWCIKEGTLSISEQQGYYYLQGLWQGYSSEGACTPGKLWLSKKKASPPQTEKEEVVLLQEKKPLDLKESPPPIEKEPAQDSLMNTKQDEPSDSKKFQGRSLKERQGAIIVNQAQVEIIVWDHKQIDGDIISLYLEEELILPRYTLSGKKKRLEIYLEPGKKYSLVLHAHNLGKVAPNTAAIQIRWGKEVSQRILSSNLNSSELIQIEYIP